MTASSIEKKAHMKPPFGKLVDEFAIGFINNCSQIACDDENIDDSQFDEEAAVNNYASAIIGFGLLANNF